MTHADIPAGLRLCRASRWNQLEDDWRTFLELPGGGGYAAEKNGEVAGTAAILRYDNFAWIAMMLVDPRERRAGIGSQLLRHALAALADVRCVGLDATPAGEPLYARHGFVRGRDLVRLSASVDADRFPAGADRVRRMESSDLTRILQRDREIFGADRGGLLTSLLRRAPQYAWIASDGADLLGYCFGRPGHLYSQAGPIVAERDDIAHELVSSCLSEQEREVIVIDAPRLAPEWLSWLQSVGFVEERPFVRMYLGTPANPGLSSQQYGISGPEFG